MLGRNLEATRDVMFDEFAVVSEVDGIDMRVAGVVH